jgi:hypothetical protein
LGLPFREPVSVDVQEQQRELLDQFHAALLLLLVGCSCRKYSGLLMAFPLVLLLLLRLVLLLLFLFVRCCPCRKYRSMLAVLVMLALLLAVVVVVPLQMEC